MLNDLSLEFLHLLILVYFVLVINYPGANVQAPGITAKLVKS